MEADPVLAKRLPLHKCLIMCLRQWSNQQTIRLLVKCPNRRTTHPPKKQAKTANTIIRWLCYLSVKILFPRLSRLYCSVKVYFYDHRGKSLFENYMTVLKKAYLKKRKGPFWNTIVCLKTVHDRRENSLFILNGYMELYLEGNVMTLFIYTL